jgi:hypothetical protein
LPGSSRKPRVGCERSFEDADEASAEDEDEGKRPNLFAALQALKKDGDGGNKH